MRAFSLIELVIVLLILSITAAIGVPRFASSMSRYRVEMAASRVMADIELMRTRARAASAPRTVAFSPTEDTYRVSGEIGLDRSSNYVVVLKDPPYDTDIALVDFGGTLALDIDGYGTVAQTGRIVLQSGSVARTVFVGTADQAAERGAQTTPTAPIDLGGGASDTLR